MLINDTARRASEVCQFDDDTGISGHLARVHCKLGLAHRFHRINQPDHYYTQLAEAAIMVMLLSHGYGLNLEKAVGKHLYGETAEQGGRNLPFDALRNYAAEWGDPSAATIDEMIWDGHQVLANAGDLIVRHILNLEANGLKPNEVSESEQDLIAYQMARVFVWIAAAVRQTEEDLPSLIERVLSNTEQYQKPGS